MKSRIFICVFLIGASAGAQPQCRIDQKLIECWQQYLPPAREWEAKAEVKARDEAAEAERLLRAVDAGLDGIVSGGSSSLQNTLSRFGLAALASDGEEDGTLALDFNFLLPAPVRDRNGQLQMIVDTSPDLFEPLKELIPEATRAEKLSELEDQIGDGDSYSLVFRYNLLTSRLGRSIEAHGDLLYELFRAVPFPAENEALFQMIELLDLGEIDHETQGDPIESIDDLQQAEQVESEGVEGLTFLQVAERLLEREGIDDPAEDRVRDRAATLVVRVEAAAAKESAMSANFESEVENYRLGSFVHLVNNQPQLLFSATRKLQDELVGTNEMEITASYEIPVGPNINRLRKELEDDGIHDCSVRGSECLEAFRDLAKEKGTDSASRFAISLSWTEIDNYSIDRPADGLVLSRDGGERLKTSLTWGRSFHTVGDDDSLVPSRLDLNLSYEDLFDDPDRQDRFVSSLTYTYTLKQGVSLPIGLVYANKPEFLQMEDVDEEISARLGLKFTLPGSSPD